MKYLIVISCVFWFGCQAKKDHKIKMLLTIDKNHEIPPKWDDTISYQMFHHNDTLHINVYRSDSVHIESVSLKIIAFQKILNYLMEGDNKPNAFAYIQNIDTGQISKYDVNIENLSFFLLNQGFIDHDFKSKRQIYLRPDNNIAEGEHHKLRFIINNSRRQPRKDLDFVIEKRISYSIFYPTVEDTMQIAISKNSQRYVLFDNYMVFVNNYWFE